MHALRPEPGRTVCPAGHHGAGTMLKKGPTALQKECKSLPLPFVIWPSTPPPSGCASTRLQSWTGPGSLRTFTPAISFAGNRLLTPTSLCMLQAKIHIPIPVRSPPGYSLSQHPVLCLHNIYNVLQLHIYPLMSVSSLRAGTMLFSPMYSFPAPNIMTNMW